LGYFRRFCVSYSQDLQREAQRDPGKVVLDGNHPLAGMALRFRLEVLAVRIAKPEEIGRGVSLL